MKPIDPQKAAALAKLKRQMGYGMAGTGTGSFGGPKPLPKMTPEQKMRALKRLREMREQDWKRR